MCNMVHKENSVFGNIQPLSGSDEMLKGSHRGFTARHHHDRHDNDMVIAIDMVIGANNYLWAMTRDGDLTLRHFHFQVLMD